MRKRHLFAGLIVSAFISTAASASSIIIDFENFAEGEFLDGLVDFGGGLTANLFSQRTNTPATGQARVCDSAATAECGSNDPDLNPLLTEVNGLGDFDLGNMLIMQNNATSEVDDDAQGAFFDFTDFQLNGAPFEFMLTSIDFIDTKDDGPSGALLFLNDDIAPFEIAGEFDFGGGDNEFERVFVNETTDRIRVSFSGSGALDNIELKAVPAPSSTLTLALSLILLSGFRAWQRRRVTG